MKFGDSSRLPRVNPSKYSEVRPSARFTAEDFSNVIANLPEGCPIVGGQAVAWWARQYGITGSKGEMITSADLDIWGTREDLKKLAKAMRRKPVFPHEYEMTVWAGAIELTIGGKPTIAEVLHTIPGLDVINPDKASVEQIFHVGSMEKIIQVLSPVSLVMAKLHALRHFEQKDRQDELHLKVSLRTSRAFITELLQKQEIRHVLWNSERLIAAHRLKPYTRLEKKYSLNILEAIPIEDLKRAADDRSQTQENRSRLANFVNLRWSREERG